MVTTAKTNFVAAGALPGTIVLSETDDLLRIRVHACLEPYGHRVLDAPTINEVDDLAARQRADVVLIDLDDQQDECWSLLNAHLHEAGRGHPPVVLITPENDNGAILDGIRHGAHDQLSKPLNAPVLLARTEAALRSKRMNDQLIAEHNRAMEMSRTDPVTGIPSRAYMEDLLSIATASAARYNQPLSIILMDLDHFTALNETHGREAGDAMLREVATHVRADLRTSDRVGRWGDDEFLVVLPHTDISGAAILANRLRLTLSEMPVRLPNGSPACTPASFGCAQGADLDEMLQSARAMLSEAKRNGRNSVRSSGTPASKPT